MRIEQCMPVTVTNLGGTTRRVHDVGEKHRGKNPIIGQVSPLVGEELGDFLEGRAPVRFNEVENVAPWKLNVLRARYAISDVLAPLGRDKGVVGVMEDECRDTDCGKQRPHIRFGQQRHHESSGTWACPQALIACPRCPDLLVPRHVRIQVMLHLPGAPPGDDGGSGLLGCGSFDALSHRIRVALQPRVAAEDRRTGPQHADCQQPVHRRTDQACDRRRVRLDAAGLG